MTVNHPHDAQFTLKLYSRRAGYDIPLHLYLTQHGWDVESRQNRGPLDPQFDFIALNDRLDYPKDLIQRLNTLFNDISSSELTATQIQDRIDELAGRT